MGCYVIEYLGFDMMRSSSPAVKSISTQFASKLLQTCQPGTDDSEDGWALEYRRQLYLVRIAIDQHEYERLNKSGGKRRL